MKDDPDDDDKCINEKKRRRRLLLLLYAHMTSNISLSLFNFNSRTTLLGKLLDNDAARMSKILARWASTIGFLEFLFNPTIGRLSDKIGRRPFMLLSPVACVLLKTWVYFSPSVTSLSFEKIVCDGLRTLSGSTMCAGNFLSFFFIDRLNHHTMTKTTTNNNSCTFRYVERRGSRCGVRGIVCVGRCFDHSSSFFIWSHVFTSTFICCICGCVCVSVDVGVQIFGGDVTRSEEGIDPEKH